MSTQNQYFPESVPHPGETLAEKLDEMEMGPKEFALRTGKPDKTISAILKGESAITPDMAIQFESVTKIPARLWLNLQRSYDEYLAREKYKATIEAAIPWAKEFPINDLIKKNWIAACSSWHEKSQALLSFFAFANQNAWEDYYFKQQLKLDFRISLASTNHPHAISAWLRQGEIQSQNLDAAEYSPQLFKDALTNIKTLVANHPDDFFSTLQYHCLQAGVKVVYTPNLPKAPINGCTRWINGTPLIQLSGRYKRNDIFWFTFYHEAGHILLHGKKDIFLESIEYNDRDLAKEKEADDFAAHWLLTKEQEEEITANYSIDDAALIEYAYKFNTHPAIIVGRLQHLRLIHPSVGRNHIIPIEL